MTATARVPLDGDELSFLIGLVRLALDECDELLATPTTSHGSGRYVNREERDWLTQRADMARHMESKLERAGSTL